MTWPIGLISTLNLDSGTADSPAAARAQLLEVVQKLNMLIDHGEPANGQLIGVRFLGTPGASTYSATTGTRFVIVEVQGAGGGGGAAGAPSAGQAAAGQGGYAGAYAKARINSGFDGVSILVGAKGAGGLATANGVTGGGSDFGGMVICGGGPGGRNWVTPGSGPGIASIGTAPATAFVSGAAEALVTMSGQIGGVGLVISGAVALPGAGGSSPMGTGGSVVLHSASATPQPARGRGSGGGGSLTMSGGGENAGGSGTDGCVLVWEFA